MVATANMWSPKSPLYEHNNTPETSNFCLSFSEEIDFDFIFSGLISFQSFFSSVQKTAKLNNYNLEQLI